jgi:sugar fermentation stimulation protein A
MAARRPAAGTAFEALAPATFLARPHRFLVHARVRGRRTKVACRDPGRLFGLLAPGTKLLLAPRRGKHRKTRYDLVLARAGGRWLSLVPVLANRIFESALRADRVPGLRGARVLAREVRHGRSRFDLLLSHRGRRVLAEVKSAGGLVRNGCALFPDAPTERGRRHLQELAAVARAGGHALVAFVVQRPDVRGFAPNRALDPRFADALDEAAAAGVRLLAYACAVSPRGCRLLRRIPIDRRRAPEREG